MSNFPHINSNSVDNSLANSPRNNKIKTINKTFLILTKVDASNLSNQINQAFENPSNYLDTNYNVIIGTYFF